MRTFDLTCKVFTDETMEYLTVENIRVQSIFKHTARDEAARKFKDKLLCVTYTREVEQCA